MNKPAAFLIQPFDEASEAVYTMIASAAAKAGVSVHRADTFSASTDFTISESIHAAIRQASFVIADVSRANANVMYEVGVAEALNRPILMIASYSRDIPIDLAGVRIYIYDLANLRETVRFLAVRMEEILERPEDFSFSTSKREQKKSVFISYSHKDREYLARLLVHLKPLEKEGLIDLWLDSRLRPGDRWKREIERALAQANVAVLLVSADFLASDFITDDELPPLLRDAEEKGTRIIPVILKPCRFTRDKNLRHFQAINDPQNSLIRISEADQETLYDAVATEIERTLHRG